jgi:hypothetical protein
MKTLIGISGKMGHGKDLLACIIQLMSHHVNLTDVQIKILIDAGYPKDTKYQLKKFADGLKHCASLLTAIPISQFEDQEFKKTFLGPEWNYWTITVLDNGKFKMQHGRYSTKEEAELNAKYLEEVYGTFRMEYVVGMQQMTVRQLLQELGTDAVRNGLHPDSWVNALMSGYVPATAHWIITDVRFPNEFKAIQEKGGLLVRINRPMMPDNTHPSETALDEGYEFDVIIDNSKNIPHLIKQVREKILPLISKNKTENESD